MTARIIVGMVLFSLFCMHVKEFSAARAANGKDAKHESRLAKHQEVVLHHGVSLVRLLATPEKYDGKRVWVRGYLTGDDLFLTREDAMHSNLLNALRISCNKDAWLICKEKTKENVTLSDLSNKYVGIEGIFSKNGVLGAEPSSLGKVNRIVEL